MAGTVYKELKSCKAQEMGVTNWMQGQALSE